MRSVLHPLAIASALTLAACACADSVKLIATYSGKDVGTAVVTITPNRDQTVTDSTTLSLAVNGHKLELYSTSRIGPTGRVLTEVQRQTQDGAVKSNVSIKYSADAAVLTDHVGGEVKSFPIPKGANVDAISGLWFISVRPKVGAKAKSYVFSPSLRQWQETERTYEGDTTLTVGQSKVTGHKLHDKSLREDVHAVVDDKGLPIEIDFTGMKLVRER